jgi:transposase InsO family protein
MPRRMLAHGTSLVMTTRARLRCGRGAAHDITSARTSHSRSRVSSTSPATASSSVLDHGITVERVLSDNGNGYRSFAWREICAELGIERRYTRPRRPQTNGKAEALVKTLLREWAYRFTYPTSSHRARALSGYLRWYNTHSSLGGQPPISRVSHVRGQPT